MRRWVYEQGVHSAEPPSGDEVFIADRVRSYLQSAGEVLYTPAPADRTRKGAGRRAIGAPAEPLTRRRRTARAVESNPTAA